MHAPLTSLQRGARDGARDTAPPGDGRRERQGLYDPEFEHDACGVAFVADMHGRRSNAIVSDALTALHILDHRGAPGSEVNTGDGAGILLQVPDAFLRAVVDIDLPKAGSYATGIAFLPVDDELARKAIDATERIAVEESL